mgnify:CR=1 FL=1
MIFKGPYPDVTIPRIALTPFAMQRAKPDAPPDDIIAEAEKLVAFVMGGVQVAAPKAGEQ